MLVRYKVLKVTVQYGLWQNASSCDPLMEQFEFKLTVRYMVYGEKHPGVSPLRLNLGIDNGIDNKGWGNVKLYA